MGYTHYWYSSKEPYPATKWDALIKDVKYLAAHLPKESIKGEPIHIAGCFAYKTAKFDKNKIHFNGSNGNKRVHASVNCWADSPDTDAGHETFHLCRTWKPAFAGETTGFGCCKTARKPYDIVVCAVLILAHYHLGLTVSSDGEWDGETEWKPARKLIMELFPEISAEIELNGSIFRE